MPERRVIWKWIWVWEFDREERWLNEMAQNGWALCGVGFCRYEFERCEPGEYTIREELHSADGDYIRFMEDIGVEYVGRLFTWVFFRKKTEYGSFDIFSDIDSRIRHLDRIGRLLSIVGAANLGIGIANSLSPVRIGWINLLCATLLMYGLGRIHGKKEALEQERLLHE